MEYIELLEEDLKVVKFAQMTTRTKYLQEDDNYILEEDLLEALKEMVDCYKNLQEEFRTYKQNEGETDLWN